MKSRRFLKAILSFQNLAFRQAGRQTGNWSHVETADPTKRDGLQQNVFFSQNGPWPMSLRLTHSLYPLLVYLQ